MDFYINLAISTFFFGFPLLTTALVHGTCIKFDWIPWSKKPLDFGKTFRGKRLFGPNKTWRGLLMACIGCLLGMYALYFLEKHWEPFSQKYAFFSYQHLSLWALALAFGVGMTLGELPNSFLKRQFEIQSGKQGRGFLGVFFILFDQVDLLVGVWCLTPLVVPPSAFREGLFWWACGASILLTAIIHFLLTLIGYQLGMRKTWL
jgi:CDP-2,3-bis-(O-geranylgeranyl)-sn-glycerol synthase